MQIKFNNTLEAKRVVRKIRALVPKDLKEGFVQGEIKAFLCGGVFVSLLRNERVQDLDFFFASMEDFEKALSWLHGAGDKVGKIFDSYNAISFSMKGMKIQFIKKIFFPTVGETIGIFDFRAVMCGMTMLNLWGNKELVVMEGHRNPHNVVFRIAKYVRRGWSIKGLSFVKLILQQLIRAKHITTLADVRDEILGLDTLILTEFFKRFEKWPPEQPLDELELKELIDDIGDYFNRWSANMDVSVGEVNEEC